MVEVKALTRDQTCGSCTRQEREERQTSRPEPIRYFQLYVFSDPQFRPSVSVCEDCARAIRNGLNLVLGGEK